MLHYANMTDKELLSTLIHERKGEGISEKLFNEFTALPNIICDTEEQQLLKIKGVGPKRASQIKSCYELARRLNIKSYAKSHIVKSPQDVADLMSFEMKFLKKEVFKIIMLDTKNHVLDIRQISEGSLNSSIVHPREVYKPALQMSASGIICIHNHPSMDNTPSREDIETTKRLVDAGNILGIKLLDHIIIGESYLSFKEQGLI